MKAGRIAAVVAVFLTVTASTIFLAAARRPQSTEAPPETTSARLIATSPTTTEELAKRLGYADPAVALSEAAVFADRLQAGYLPNAWTERCRSLYHSSLCAAAEDYFGPKMSVSDGSSRRRRQVPALLPKNLEILQDESFQNLLAAYSDVATKTLRKLAPKILERKACPRNLSLALARSIETRMAEKGNYDLMMQLDAHGLECLSPKDPAAEFAFFRSGLFRWAKGDKAEALALIEKSLSAETKREEWRVLYWQWRMSRELNKPEGAARALARLQIRFPISWQTVLAQTASGVDPLAFFERNGSFPDAEFSDSPLFDRRWAWMQLMLRSGATAPQGLSRYGEFTLQTLSVDNPPGAFQVFARRMDEAGHHRLQILALTALLQNRPTNFGMPSMRLLFPRPYFDEIARETSGKVDLALVMALARQESSFDPNAVSRANAQGLLQVLPSVARSLRKQAKLSNYVHNIEVGVKHLNNLSRMFNGSIEKALASYNAGPGNVRKWENRFESIPFSAQDPQLFVDLIPFRETRDYVSAVLRNAYWYHRLYPDFRDHLKPETATSYVLRQMLHADFTGPAVASVTAAVSESPQR